MELNKEIEIQKYIEQTVLKPDTLKEDIERVCSEAQANGFFGVCVPPYFVKYARSLIKGNQIKVITVVGFPLGYNSVGAKVEETKRAIEDGADEIDMVINITALKAGDFMNVNEGINSVATMCRLKAKHLKVIIETALLSDSEIAKACDICAEANVDFVKTSTGFFGGATVAHIKIMRELLPEKIKIKASGGIKTREFALELIQAGADRIGTSSGVALMKNIEENQ